MSLTDCKIVELPKIADPRGNLTFIEANRHIPFTINGCFTFTTCPAAPTAPDTR